MRFLTAAATAFAVAFMTILAAMLTAQWLGLRHAPVWVGAGIASGCALSFGAKAQWQLPRNASIALLCVLVIVGYLAGTWLSR